ncbi:MAG: hypothetical protein WAT34_08975 [Chitinophagaceae bacterium]
MRLLWISMTQSDLFMEQSLYSRETKGEKGELIRVSPTHDVSQAYSFF